MLRKILFMCLYPPHQGGSACSNFEFTRGLSKNGYEVEVIAQLDEGCMEFDKWSKETLGIPIHRTPIEEGYAGEPPTKNYLVKVNDFIRDFLRNRSILGGMPDIVVLGFDPWAYHESVIHDFYLPVVQHVRGTPTRAIMEGIYTPKETKRFLEHLCNADHIVTVAEHFRDALPSYGFSTQDITVINSGVDTSLFYPTFPNRRLKEELKIGDDKRVIVHASNMWPVKHVCDIVESANKVLVEHDDVVYSFVGDGPDSSSLQEVIRKSSYSDHFRLKGWIPHSEVPAYMNLGEIFILSSESEGRPRATMEAQACGLYLIASDMPAGLECTLDGKIGTNYRTGDPDDLAKKTLFVLNMDKGSFDEVTSKARRYILSECTFDKQLLRYIDCLQNVYSKSIDSLVPIPAMNL